MTYPQLASAEGTLRGWLQSCAAISAVTGERQYFAMPQKDRPQTPFIVLYRIGGAPDQFGQDYPDVIIECWGSTKIEADSLGRVVAREIMAIERPVLIEVNLGPVPSTGTPYAKRYRIDASFHIRTA